MEQHKERFVKKKWLMLDTIQRHTHFVQGREQWVLTRDTGDISCAHNISVAVPQHDAFRRLLCKATPCKKILDAGTNPVSWSVFIVFLHAPTTMPTALHIAHLHAANTNCWNRQHAGKQTPRKHSHQFSFPQFIVIPPANNRRLPSTYVQRATWKKAAATPALRPKTSGF